MLVRDRGAEQSFKHAFHRAQELSIPKKLRKEGERPAWLSQDIQV